MIYILDLCGCYYLDIGPIYTGQSIAEWLKKLPGIGTDENAVKLGQMLIDNKDVFNTDGSRY